MSRQHQRHHHHHPLQQQQLAANQQQLTAQQQQQQALLMEEHAAAAKAAELFDLLCVATTMRQILALHREMCEAVGLRPSPLNDFYPKLKAKVRSWKAQALWKKFDARAAHRVYGKGMACSGTRVLVIGAGPCGLRTAIEAQLLGAKVVVLEKRDRITRNNVLHLWPFVITDLRNLGAKKFYGKFCAGSIDHISIRQLQCMLLKVALLLGVEIHEGVSFEHPLEPSEDSTTGWRAAVSPADHAVSHYEFDVLIGADGKRNMLDFRRKEFRGKLAIAITANFINKKTEAEAKVEEISGVAFIFNQAFFKELYGKTGIDLENIVYYKDETHYFVMTAKKHSLIDKGVIIEDMADPGELLAPANVDTQKLHDYAREAAEFSTQYQMPNLEFAVNHYGKPDVAMFDFTSMFAAEMSCRVIVRKGCRLMQCLVGDSLLEPFWPTGSGCARGFLSSMDAAYAIKLWSNPQNSTLGVLAQRESIYRLLNQTTPDTLQRDISAYTVDPATRYPNLNRESVNSWQVKHLIDTDDPTILEQTFMDATHATLQLPRMETPGRRKRRSGDLLPQGTSLLRWISAQLNAYHFAAEMKEPSDVFRNGRVLCALINRYRPDLIDYAATKDMTPMESNELAFAVLDRELHIDRIMSAKQSIELTEIESSRWLNYLDQICEVFRGEIPHIKHPKMDFSDLRQKYRMNHTHAQPDFSKLLQTKPKAKSPMQDAEDIPTTVQRRSVLEDERAKRQRRHEQLLNSVNATAASGGAGGGGSPSTNLSQGQSDRRSKKRRQADKTANISSKVALAFKKQAASEKCRFCKQTVYLMEKTTVEGLILHRNCLKCHHCHTNLRLGGYAFDRDDPQGRFYCTQHFRLPAKPLPQRSNKARKSAGAQVAATAGSAAPAAAEPMDTTPLRDQVDLLETSRASAAAAAAASADAMSDDEANVIDEHEWSGRNFLPESNNDSQSELSSSDESDTESDSELFEEADDSPFGAQTLQLASDWIGKQYCEDSDDSDDFYDSSEGIADDGKDDTEGEEFKKAREKRREEVRLQPLPANLPTDTETEKLKLDADNKENNERASLKSINSFESAKSQPETPTTPMPTTRVELEQLERNAPRKFSSEIEAISEKLYHLNNMVKMNKDLEVLAKENLVKSDILRKLTLKEKWLAENAAIAAGMANPVAPVQPQLTSPPKSKFDEKYEKVVSPSPSSNLLVVEPKPKPVIDFDLDELKPRKPNFDERPQEMLPKPASLQKPTKPSPKPERKNAASTNVSRSNSMKSNASSSGGSPRLKKTTTPKMHIQNILGTIKKIERQHSKEEDDDEDAMDVDVPQENKELSNKLKEIQASSFAGTMDHIKSQLTMPTVSSSQAAATMDLSKYFPNQKQEKNTSANTNKNQKTLKDVDLAKYFPSSPVPQRRTVETVAERLKKSQTEASLAKPKEIPPPASQSEENKTKPVPPKRQASLGQNFSLRDHPQTEASPAKPKEIPPPASQSDENKTKPVPPKRQASLGQNFSLRDHQMDGAVDLTKKKAPTKVAAVVNTVKKPTTTTVGKATTTTKGKVKIVKKIVPKGTKAAKKAAAEAAAAAAVTTTTVEKEPPRDEAERILDEILGDGATRSPSSEYQKLFQDEKSPSDLSDNIDRILEETGLNLELGLPRRSSSKAKLQKTKSLGEGDFEMKPSSPRLTGVQNILKRFESLSSVSSHNSEDQAFKLRRMESTTSNLSSLNRSRESLVSVTSDSMSDLEKTMDYLRNEWRNEATNFLQKKRNKFYAQKEEQQQKQAEIKSKADPIRDLPVQYRESKISKFFGLGSRKSPEKRKSPIKKKKSPTKSQKMTASKANNSLEELANISNARQAKQAQKKANKLNVVTKKPVEKPAQKPSTPVPDDFEILDLLDKATEAKEHERAQTKSPAIETPVQETPINSPMISQTIPIEDIKNLPKTGCDKSLNNSRRGSQVSLILSRRNSGDISLTEKLNQDALAALSQLEKEHQSQDVEKLFQSMVEEMDQEPKAIAVEDVDADADSLCTTISKSPSAQPITVVKRGSSEEHSIEKLFGDFSDEMLVNVEFDSNDELIGISPRATVHSSDSADRDYIDKLESLERDVEPVGTNTSHNDIIKDDEVDGLHFPSRPQRRQKSSSSSSEPTMPVPPQRLRNKLAKLDPESMPPSVQDLLEQHVHPDRLEIEKPREAQETLRFPTIVVEQDEMVGRDQVLKQNEMLATDQVDGTVSTKTEETKEKPAGTPKSQSSSLKSENSSQGSLNEVPKIVTPPKQASKENSSDWDMEKMPASPMPRRKQQTQKTTASKESSLEWDMEKMPNSPMPPRRNKLLHNISPSNSIQLLNNISDVNEEAAQRRLIDDIERERRQALIKRDENFEVIAAEQRRRDSLQSSSNSSSKRSLPPPSSTSKPTIVKGSQSRATTQDTNRTDVTKREGTPPMFKKLDIDGTSTPLDSTTCSTRRSSFAFIELQDNKPVIVPMPKKLNLPKKEAIKFVPEIISADEPVPEVFQGRSWPKAQIEGLTMESDDEGLDDLDEEEKRKKLLPEYARSDSPPSAAFKNRQWPDGKTVFPKDQRSDSIESDDILGLLKASKRRNLSNGTAAIRNKPRSQSPQPFKPLTTSSRQSSKSYSDLKKGVSTHASLQSLSAQSSQDATDSHSTTATTVTTSRPPVSYINYDESVDASTKALLDRSKKLHNRKRDFVNERVVERNPYMRDVIRSTDRNDYYDGADDDLSSYRPRHYAPSTTTTTSRFPSTSTQRSNNYDYLSRRPISYASGLGGGTTTSSYYPSTTSSSTPRSSHLSDLFKRRSPASSSRYGDYSHLPSTTSKESRRLNYYYY
ncbi:F-actin-monooxygenase Mical isoform X12 [Drosophila tropicalis]|uniref:F-actin-monooxygenase Mical isoform X12 n=1 Tax=Drosophila tropicalis TaxID=46794 RepID=UPI0035ABAE3C